MFRKGCSKEQPFFVFDVIICISNSYKLLINLRRRFKAFIYL